MPEPKLGNRHECSECGAKFYDLGRPTAICPKCGTVQDDSSDAPSRKRRKSPTAGKDTADDQAEELENEELEDEDEELEDEDKDADEEDDEHEEDEDDRGIKATDDDFDLDDIDEDEDEDE